MALDTVQKRGTAIHLGSPWRSWAAAPDGTLNVGDRQGLMYLGSAIASGILVIVSTAFQVLFRSAPRYGLVARSEPRYDPEVRSVPRYGVIRRTDG
jgi:hypothetical protein